MTVRPHDALFKATFGMPAYAVQLFHAVLPPALFSALDWTQLRAESASFIDRELEDHHGDLLFSLPRSDDGTRVLLYVLVEHQSRPDADMPLRMLCYLAQIWARERRHAPSSPLPVIVPLVISHAPEGWLVPDTLGAMFDADATHLGTLFTDFVPRFRVLVEDLARVTNAEIRTRLAGEIPRLVWWVLRDARSRDRLLANIAAWGDMLEAAVRADMASLLQIVAYLGYVLDPFPVEEFRAKLKAYAPTAGGVIMTMQEQLLRQGRAEGRAEGRREMFRQLLQKRFGELTPAQREQIENARSDELDRWLERLFGADSIDTVLAPG